MLLEGFFSPETFASDLAWALPSQHNGWDKKDNLIFQFYLYIFFQF